MSFVTVSEYINSFDENTQKYLLDFENYMKSEFPSITPKICFSMPMWWLGSKMYDGYIGISAAKKHYSIHFHDEYYITKMKQELPTCTFGKRCINIKYGDMVASSVAYENVKQYLKSKLF